MENSPPDLQKAVNGDINIESLANTVEWFLNYDERVAAVRHPQIEAVYQWRQQDAQASGMEMTPFDRAEDRFAVGIFQALGENDSEPKLQKWMNDLLATMQEAKELKSNIAKDFDFDQTEVHYPIEEANLLPSNIERRLYLSACWLDALCTAELRVLGWVYQQLYNKPFAESR